MSRSVKVGPKHTTKTAVVREGHPRPSTSKPKIGSENSNRPAPVRGAAPSEYPASWRVPTQRNTVSASVPASRRPASITASRPAPHGTGSTAALIRAQQNHDLTRVQAEQAKRTSRLHDRHVGIAAAGSNARRLRAAELTELERMASERARRAR